MAKIRSGILGNIRGKVSGVVGGQWKDVNYLREYVKPANPNTAAQQTQRSKMTGVVEFCKALVGPIFNAYTDKFQKSMSGFNYFIKSNIAEFDGSPDLSNVKLSSGKLSPVLLTGAVYVPGAGSLTIAWTANLGNNGVNDDRVFCAAYHEPTGIWYFTGIEEARSDLEEILDLPTGLTATDLHVWAVTSKYAGTLVSMISDSSYVQGSA